MNKIGIFFADGLEEIEGLTVVDIMRRAGMEAIMISITDSLHVMGVHQIEILADKTFEQIAFDTLDGLVLPGGGPGTDNLLKHEGVNEQIEQFAEEGKLVAAICAAPSVLGRAGLLKGKKATCYPGFEDKLIGAEICTNKVVTDGNIITSRGMGTAIPFALALVAYYMGEEKSREIKKAIIYGHE